MEYNYNILNYFNLDIPPMRLCQYAMLGASSIVSLVESNGIEYNDPRISFETIKDDYITLRTLLNMQ